MVSLENDIYLRLLVAVSGSFRTVKSSRKNVRLPPESGSSGCVDPLKPQPKGAIGRIDVGEHNSVDCIRFSNVFVFGLTYNCGKRQANRFEGRTGRAKRPSVLGGAAYVAQ
jgi:hypothetical protein